MVWNICGYNPSQSSHSVNETFGWVSKVSRPASLGISGPSDVISRAKGTDEKVFARETVQITLYYRYVFRSRPRFSPIRFYLDSK
jgi:hypothetical protein